MMADAAYNVCSQSTKDAPGRFPMAGMPDLMLARDCILPSFSGSWGKKCRHSCFLSLSLEDFLQLHLAIQEYYHLKVKDWDQSIYENHSCLSSMSSGGIR